MQLPVVSFLRSLRKRLYLASFTSAVPRLSALLTPPPACLCLRLGVDTRHLRCGAAQVKSIGKCVFNSLWVGRCFGKPALEALKKEAVICSGSTLGSFRGIHHYVRTHMHAPHK